LSSALGFADSDHLLRVRSRELAPIRDAAAFTDLGEIFSHILRSFCHSRSHLCIISGPEGTEGKFTLG